MDEITARLRHFILSTQLPGESPDSLRDDTPLQSSGILDSLAVLNLETFIQEEFGVVLDVYETTLERFDRIADIAATIRRKTAPSWHAEGPASCQHPT